MPHAQIKPTVNQLEKIQQSKTKIYGSRSKYHKEYLPVRAEKSRSRFIDSMFCHHIFILHHGKL